MKEQFKLIKGLFTKEKCLSMARRLEDLLQRGVYRQPDNQCRLSPAFYGVFNDELTSILPKLESEIEEELYPCYTYSRIYQENEFLVPHFDRPGAEISLTMTLDYDQYIWPFWFQKTNGEFEEVILDIGDALVYKGSEVSHFRHPMIGQAFQHQTFFHCVKKYGSYARLKYDEREKLLSNEESEKWNFTSWTDQEFMKDSNSVLNRIEKD